MERSAVACGWAKMHRFGWMILLGLVGCASQAPQIHPEVARLERFVGDFRAAVEAGDAAALYDMMAADVRDAYTIDEFRDDFQRHRSLYIEYGARLSAALEAGAYDVRAQYAGNPCGRGELVVSDMQWKWVQLPDVHTFDDVDEQKRQLALLIQTQRFNLALSAYAEAHPEWSASDQRKLRRALGFEALSSDDITFRGNHALIQIADVAQIDMVCTPQGWRVDKCISYRSTK